MGPETVLRFKSEPPVVSKWYFGLFSLSSSWSGCTSRPGSRITFHRAPRGFPSLGVCRTWWGPATSQAFLPALSRMSKSLAQFLASTLAELPQWFWLTMTWWRKPSRVRTWLRDRPWLQSMRSGQVMTLNHPSNLPKNYFDLVLSHSLQAKHYQISQSFFKRANPASFYLFLSFLSTVQKNYVASGIRTRIFGVEGKRADH